MLKLQLVCSSCNEKSMAFDQGDSVLEIDFSAQTIGFNCPKCGAINQMNLGKIESLLLQRTKLPSIRGANL